MTARKGRKGADRVAEPGDAYGPAQAASAVELLEALRADPVTRMQISALLGIPAGLPDALDRLTAELREQRREGARDREVALQRFEATDRRFEEADRRFEELRSDMNARFEATDRRFEAVDRRFEELRSDMNARFEAVDRRFDRIEGIQSVTNLHLGRFAHHAGHQLEDLVAAALRFALARPEIRPENVRLRQQLVDLDGRFGRKGRQAEIDVVAADGRTYLLEVKLLARAKDVRLLADEAEFAATVMELEPGTWEAVLATPIRSDEIVDACREHHVTLV